ncbi:hypothetical protein AMECASPLE_034937 [Ameca splendens]|uniref:Uncharacterized protein n=1 Tax=Ameca splendens TaxID=208324 RepID=A0ABV0ZS52_9TELE
MKCTRDSSPGDASDVGNRTRSPAEGECSKWVPSYIASCDVRLGRPVISVAMSDGICRSGLSWIQNGRCHWKGLVTSNNVQMVQYSANKWSNNYSYLKSMWYISV